MTRRKKIEQLPTIERPYSVAGKAVAWVQVTQPNGEPLPAPCAIAGCQYDRLAKTYYAEAEGRTETEKASEAKPKHKWELRKDARKGASELVYPGDRNARTTVDNSMRTCCPECGPNIGIDEDGCCVSCGWQAYPIGAWMLKELTALRASLAQMTQERDDAKAAALIARTMSCAACGCASYIPNDRCSHHFSPDARLQTEIEMHNAWEKRAYEAEASLAEQEQKLTEQVKELPAHRHHPDDHLFVNRESVLALLAPEGDLK